MTKGKKTMRSERMRELADILSRSTKMSDFDQPDEPAAWNIAFTLLEIEESFRRFLELQLPKLRSGELSERKIDDLLLEIGEEFRHVIYHLRDAPFYQYLINSQE